jgi:hypothetical protein
LPGLWHTSPPIVAGGIGNIYYDQLRQYESILPKDLYFCGPGYFRDTKQIAEPWRTAVVAFRARPGKRRSATVQSA